MSSSTASTPNIPGKPGSNSASAPSSQLALQPPGSVVGFEPSRRTGGGSGGNSGAGSNTRNGMPRNNQASRKGHRNHRKPDSLISEEHNYDCSGYDEAATSSSTRKGTSIAINWDYSAPHPRAYGEFRPRNQRRNPTWGLGSGYHAVDKARYVNANYRFIVNPHGDYRAQCIDSDVHLPWDHILQILASALTQCPNCPICLSTPVAPRMAKCGHIFCLPCLDRYMASTDGNKPQASKPRYRKCVICTDSVYMTDIRSVRFITGQQTDPPKEGDDVVLRLVMRKPGSTLALPRDGADPPSALDEIPWHFAAEVMDYARIMKGSDDYMMEQFNREIVELEQMQLEDELLFGEDGVWARKAIETIRGQMEGLAGIGNPPLSIIPQTEKEKEKEKRPPIVFSEATTDVPLMYHVMHEARSGHSSSSHTPKPGPPNADSSVSAAELSSSLIGYEDPRQRAGVGASSDSPYFFYQALLHHYLSPLDIRILKVTFGSFANFPATILPRVENVSTGHTVDDDLRKRARYLAHLPYGCEVTFLECDWTDIVPSETLEKFKGDIERRRKRKREKETREERDRIRAEKLEEDEKWSALRHRRRESAGFLKEKLKDEDFVALGHSEPADGETGVGTSPSQATDSSVTVPQQRTVWGTPAIAVSQEEPVHHRAEDNSGWLPDWERELMLEEETLAQIEMEEAVSNGGGSGSGGRAPSRGKGQKKKFKKVTLMTNGGKRGA